MHVVGAREAAALPQCLPDAAALQQRGGNREPGVREPRKRGQDEDPDEQADRQEDDDAEGERGQERPARGTRPGRERTGADVGEREGGSGENEQRRLNLRLLADGELVERGDDRPERERGEEAAPVEPDRLGDELADSTVASVNFGVGRGHERGRYRARRRQLPSTLDRKG